MSMKYIILYFGIPLFQQIVRETENVSSCDCDAVPQLGTAHCIIIQLTLPSPITSSVNKFILHHMACVRYFFTLMYLFAPCSP